jgi:hypothetical protein
VVLTDSKKLSLDPAPIGLHAFIIQRTKGPPRYYYLERVAKLRLAHMPPSSGITWTRGKGVIGRCWAEQRIVAVPTGKLYAKVTAQSAVEWDKLPNEIRLNLTYPEFCQIRHKYSGVIAIPIFDQAKRVRGCVALDSVGSEPFEDLMQDGIYEVLQDAAVAIGKDLSRVPLWVYPPGEELRDG